MVDLAASSVDPAYTADSLQVCTLYSVQFTAGTITIAMNAKYADEKNNKCHNNNSKFRNSDNKMEGNLTIIIAITQTIWSSTKNLTALAMACLVDRGLLSYSDK